MSQPKHRLQKTALIITEWVGSVPSILLHTVIFVLSFVAAYLELLPFDRMLLVLTTIVSLEAIYLAIFIQMTINVQREALEEVEHDIDEIQEDIDEIQEDVEEMHEGDKEEEEREAKEEKTLEEIRAGLQKLMQDVEKMQRGGAQ